jgi:hypothetical protein
MTILLFLCYRFVYIVYMEVESIGLIFIAMGMKIGRINIVRAMYSIEYNPTKIPWSPPH